MQRFPWHPIPCALAATLLLGAPCEHDVPGDPSAPPELDDSTMDLGNFSISLAVKDLAASRAFYEKLGFEITGGNADQNWLILQNATSTIGLFQGMFEDNILTFNPGWDRDSNTLDDFEDVRDLQSQLEERGIEITRRADDSTDGPTSFVLVDPDGNPILVDQHVARPSKD